MTINFCITVTQLSSLDFRAGQDSILKNIHKKSFLTSLSLRASFFFSLLQMSQPTPLFQARPLTTNTTNNDTLNKKPLVTCESYTDAYNTSMHQRQLQFFSYLAGFSALLTLLFQSEITFNLCMCIDRIDYT